MYLTPAVFAASSNLCVIIPSSIRYSISDCPEILPTNSLIATLKTSCSFEFSAIASSDSFNSENIFLQTSDSGPSLSSFSSGAFDELLISFTTGLKISSTLFGVSSSTSIPSSALNS